MNREQRLEKTLSEVRSVLLRARSRPGRNVLMHEEAVALALELIQAMQAVNTERPAAVSP